MIYTSVQLSSTIMSTGALGLDMTKEWSCLYGTYVFRYNGDGRQRGNVLVKYTAIAVTPGNIKRLRTCDITKRVVIREPKPLEHIKEMLPEFRGLRCEDSQEKVILKELFSVSVIFGCLNFLIDLHQKVREDQSAMVIKEYEITVDLKCLLKSKLLNCLTLLGDGYAPIRIIQSFNETFFDMNINDDDHNNWRLSREYVCARNLREKISTDSTFLNFANISSANMMLLWNEMQADIQSTTKQPAKSAESILHPFVQPDRKSVV